MPHLRSPHHPRRTTRCLAVLAAVPVGLTAVALSAGAGSASAVVRTGLTTATAATAATTTTTVTEAKALPTPHPVAPTMQVLQPRGVDAAAVRQLRSATPQLRAALTPGPSEAAAPALAIAPTRTSPFQLVGLTWATKGAPAGIDITVRVREHGVWGSWQVLGVEDAGPDPDTAEGRAAAAISGSDPLLSDGADGVQVVVHTSSGRAPAGLKVDLINAGTSAADGEPPTPAAPIGSAASSPATATPATATPATATATATATPTATATSGSTPAPLGTASSAPVGIRPAIITRAQWGADESIRKPVDYNSTVKAMVVHHTDTTNSYTTLAQAEQQVRAVYAFHVEGRGWSDIGYNFVVDHFGHIFEGRAGSITKAIMGAHTGGFNTDTMGVAALGTYTTATPPKAMVSSIAKVVAWKMGQYGMNVNGTATLTSAGGGTSRYPAGKVITVAAVTGHRTFGRTECPGDGLWAKLATIRSQATAIIAAEPKGTGYWPLTGVWTAGGGVQPGWFRHGYWWLRQPDGSTVKIHFGEAGDEPVVADWNGDGVTGIGVYRDGTWYITSELTAASPPHDATFVYGGPGFLPIAGVWPGQTTLGIGVVAGHTWSMRSTVSAGPSFTTFVYGEIGDLPIVADWDGNGTTTPAVLRLGHTWYLTQNIQGPATNVFVYGTFADTPSAADWDGNGTVTPSIVRTDQWYLRNDLKGGNATQILTYAPS